MEKQTEIFKALSDKSRLRILKMLSKKSLCVCEITEVLQLATSTVSNHLSILKDTGLIIDKKDKKWINYQLNPHPDDPAVSSVLVSLHLLLEDDELVKKDKEMIKTVNREVLCSKT
ncbi:MAG: ArsR family transcriptional regulator [Ignavibacteriae bacterium]|nr:MAG: ArsR family transcriptional regulator [Ignavibacteriota bacterium]